MLNNGENIEFLPLSALTLALYILGKCSRLQQTRTRSKISVTV